MLNLSGWVKFSSFNLAFWSLTCSFYLFSLDISPKFDYRYQTYFKSALHSFYTFSLYGIASGALTILINHVHSM